MENNNPLRLNDIHSEINYDSEWYELFYKNYLEEMRWTFGLYFY